MVVQRSRYYNNVSHVRCYNCGENGHISSACPRERAEICTVCLENHHVNSCKYQICRMCNRQGHTFKNCNSRVARIFDWKPDDFLSCFSARREYKVKKVNASKILCINCNQYGHANCQDQGVYDKEHEVYQLPINFNNKKVTTSVSSPDFAVLCSNCGKKSHGYADCSKPRVEELIRMFRSPLETCFICYELGHQRELCPRASPRRFTPRQNHRSRFSQYNRDKSFSPNYHHKRRRNQPQSEPSYKRRRYNGSNY